MNSHSSIRELLGAYALDAVEPDERRLVESHLPSCSQCSDEVDRHLLVASMIADTAEHAPGSVWDRVEATITDDAEQSSTSNVIPFRRRTLPTLLSIAAAVLVAVVGVQATQINSLRTDIDVTNRALDLMQAEVASGDFAQVMVMAAAQPGSQTVELDGEMGSATVVILSNGTGYLEIAGMEPADAGHVYQLWAVQSGEVISAGLMGTSPSITPFHIDAPSLEGLVLTLEESGGVAVSSQTPAAAWLPGV